jgi:hypothetical protein
MLPQSELDEKRRARIRELLVAGKTGPKIVKILEAEGYGTVTKQAVYYYAHNDPEVAAAIEEFKRRAIKKGIGDRLKRTDKLKAMAMRIEAKVNQLLTLDGEDFSAGAVKALASEYREFSKQVSIEVGDWTEKREMSGPNGTAIPITFTDAIDKIYGDGEPEERV